MNAPESRRDTPQLAQLDRRNAWMWVMAVLLLVALGASVVVVYLTQTGDELATFFPAPETRGLLAGALCGVIALFSLYVLLKQGEMRQLRNQLVDVSLQQESLRSRLAGLSSLLEGIAGMALHLDLDAVLQALAEHVRVTLRADQVSVMLLDPERSELDCRAVAGMDAEFVRGARVPLGQGISGRVARQNEGMLLNNDDMTERFAAQRKTDRNIHTALCVPLAVRGQVIGVLNVNRLESGTFFTAEDLRMLGVFGAHAAIAIQRIVDRRHDEQIRKMKKMEALGRLASGIAHDFNNLLTVILSSVFSAAIELEAKRTAHRDLERIRNAAERCAGLTGQLLTFGRGQVVRTEAVDLNTSVTCVCDLLCRVIGENIELVTRFDPDAGQVRADAGQIEQVVLNLALNARDAMPAGGTLIVETGTVRLERPETTSFGSLPPGEYARLRVHDTGIGMDAETCEHVFEPFFTLKGHTGTGLGLATVFGIVTQSGGRVSVESELGRGTVFEVILPRAAESQTVMPEETPAQASRPEGSNVLVVEDEEAVREIVCRFLELGGYHVRSAADGATAIDLANASLEPIDLLLTDVIMPGLSGREVADRLRALRPQLPVLFMSGYTGDVLDQHGISAPGVALLQKPFTPEILLRKVAAMVPGSGGEATPHAPAA